MVTNDERREVARRLRELPIDMYEVEERWEAEGLGTDCHDQTDYSLIHNVLFGCLPAEHMHLCDYEELHMRLADLIEPEPERTCHMTKIGGDRILAGWCECSECGPVYPPCKDEIAKWALQKCPRCGAKVVEE